jgi:ComF family protein
VINLASFYKNVHPYFEALLDFIYPPYCIVCKAHLDSGAKLVCEYCWRRLPRLQNMTELSDEKCQKSPISRFLAVWQYSDELQTIIHEMKYYGKKSLAQSMGEEMAKIVAASQEYSSADAIVPVPLHKTRLRERGFNQSVLLAQKITSVSKISVEAEILKRVRYTRSQSKLSATERELNVQGAFKVVQPRPVRGKVVILVDDVFTTGSTLKACAEALIDSGVAKVLALTAAMAD